jgi:hypothetical protein
MIIVNVKNGLGNQMFQYAFGRVLEWKYQVPVLFDFMREIGNVQLRTDLDIFSIDKINEPEVRLVIPFKPFSVRKFRDQKKYFHYIYFKLRRQFQSSRLITESYPSQYSSFFDNLDLKKRYYFLGFWQNSKYYEGYEAEIRKLFVPKDKSVFNSEIALELKASQYDTVSLHIRRGDYLTAGFIEPASLDYYETAVKLMRNKLSNPYFYIFTDDPQWVLNEFIMDCPYQLITGNVGKESYKDIILMSLCQHHIIANSSFSWWGAWLNPSLDKVVMAPMKWYSSSKRDKYTLNITPKGWIRL